LQMNCTGAWRIICHVLIYREKAVNINH
jgi:hypothetical protein